MLEFIVQLFSFLILLGCVLAWLSAAGEFPPRPSKRERREQIEDDRKEGPLWVLDRG
jgi:hypothetical protein